MAHLNTDTLVMFLIVADGAFHSCAPSTEKDLLPNFVIVRGVGGFEPTAARMHRDSNSCVFDVGFTSTVVDGIHHKTALVTSSISNRQPV